jgi:hypothetical protein
MFRPSFFLTAIAALSSCAAPVGTLSPDRLAVRLSAKPRSFVAVEIKNKSHETIVLLKSDPATNFQVIQGGKKEFSGAIGCRFYRNHERVHADDFITLAPDESLSYHVPIADLMEDYKLKKREFSVAYQEAAAYAIVRQSPRSLPVERFKESEDLKSLPCVIRP